MSSVRTPTPVPPLGPSGPLPLREGRPRDVEWGHTQAHFLRAALESVAYEYAYYLGILGELIPDLRLVEARAIGGGARNALWNQIKTDVLGVPYQRLRRGEFATWGCALIAGHAVGLFPDLAEAADRFAEPGDGRFQPRTELYQLYREHVGRYIRFQEALSSTFHTLEEKAA